MELVEGERQRYTREALVNSDEHSSLDIMVQTFITFLVFGTARKQLESTAVKPQCVGTQAHIYGRHRSYSLTMAALVHACILDSVNTWARVGAGAT